MNEYSQFHALSLIIYDFQGLDFPGEEFVQLRSAVEYFEDFRRLN